MALIENAENDINVEATGGTDDIHDMLECKHAVAVGEVEDNASRSSEIDVVG